MALPIELKGVIRGKTIALDEETFLPDGYRITLHLVLEPDEALRLACGAWAGRTPEDVADLARHLSDLHGHPVKLPPEGGS